MGQPFSWVAKLHQRSHQELPALLLTQLVIGRDSEELLVEVQIGRDLALPGTAVEIIAPETSIADLIFES